MVNVWRLMAHHEPNQQLVVIDWAVQNGRVAVGWSELGELQQELYAEPADIVESAHNIDDFLGLRNLPRCGIQLWNFWGGAGRSFCPSVGVMCTDRSAMQCGDLVILKTSTGPRHGWQNSVVMRVNGPYEHVPAAQAPFGYQHQRKASVTKIDPQVLWNDAGRMQPGQFIRNALIQCQYQVGCQAGQSTE